MSPRTLVFHMARRSLAFDSSMENRKEVRPSSHVIASSVVKASARAFVLSLSVDSTWSVSRHVAVTVFTVCGMVHSSSVISPAANARS